MHVERIYDSGLAQASYLISGDASDEAMVVDPARDITPYLALARSRGPRITRVAETHIHADFVSGTRELVAATGAVPLLSGEGGPDWQYRFAAGDGATLLHDGDVITFGTVRATVLHVPGHTPEHIAFLLTDTATPDAAPTMLSGDFLFVGDVGRPDLLEQAAGVAGSADPGARQLFASLRRLNDLPDTLAIWPGHGAGSACGKSLGSAPSTTLGDQRRQNWALQASDINQFVANVLADQPAPPPYFARMKRINRDGPTVLGVRPPPRSLPAAAFRNALNDGVVIDLRTAGEYAGNHLAGTINLPLRSSFTKWAGWLISPDRPVYLIAPSAAAAAEAQTALASIGIDAIAGAFDLEVLAGRDAGQRVTTHSAPIDTADRLHNSGVMIVDVREANEWQAGHLPYAIHAPLGRIEVALRDVDRATPVAVHCQGGTRSAIAASVLEQMGFAQVTDLAGGWDAVRQP